MFQEDENISLITNDNIYKNTTIKAIKNELLQLSYSSNSLTIQAALLKSKTLFNKQSNILKNLVFISDFQEDKANLNIQKDSLLNYHLVKLNPVNTSNISIDSVYIADKNATNIELKVILKNNGNPIENLTCITF